MNDCSAEGGNTEFFPKFAAGTSGGTAWQKQKKGPADGWLLCHLLAWAFTPASGGCSNSRMLCSGLSLRHLEGPQPSQGDGWDGETSLSPEMVAL